MVVKAEQQILKRANVARIVGLGASAGGLVPLEQFIRNIPIDSGMAYIVVQHLDPTHTGLLPELLQRVTTLQVHEARHQMPIRPNSVYVIPSNTELTVINGLINLRPPVKPRGMRLPINILFSSLASNQGELAIGVLLSGMGSDGTQGMQAIKAVGGLTVVQQPDTAEFDSMPQSAINAGYGDIIATPAELPARILAYCNQMPKSASNASGDTETAIVPQQKIVDLLQRQTRHDFSQYKHSTLHRRIERRMAIHAIATMALYADYLEKNPQEIDLLFKELLIGVTSFFRDPSVWQHLAKEVLPELLARRSKSPALRAWVIGCSTGEEAYSLAMVYSEAVQKQPQDEDFSLQIFASDLSPDAIAAARRGEYPTSIRENVSADRLKQFFTDHKSYYKINSTIRNMVLFAQHNVLLDPPYTNIDLLVCRNLLIYFDAGLQRKLLPLFHYSLRAGGVLMLGSSETIGRFSDLFVPLESKLRLYQRQDNVSKHQNNFLIRGFPPFSRLTKELPMTPPKSPSTVTDSLQKAADQLLLQIYAPAAVVVNRGGDIIYISGHTGKYLEPAAGKANWNFHVMLREGLREPLIKALKKYSSQDALVKLPGLEVSLPDGMHTVDVTMQALKEPAALRGLVMFVFNDVASPPVHKGQQKSKPTASAVHTAELQKLNSEIQSLYDENRTTQEELQSANEELQSANEELQSSNEELTTSQEEMQSMNEELQTINAELQSKLDDLSLAQSDIQNILNSIDVAIMFLDQDLKVRRFSDRVSKIFNLRESDVGRPLSDLTSTLQYPDLYTDVAETLRTLVSTEKQILTTDDHWFAVRIMPYRRLDNVIDGVVITFFDISTTKRLEASLREKSE